jgi:hypothetical protein
MASNMVLMVLKAIGHAPKMQAAHIGLFFIGVIDPISVGLIGIGAALLPLIFKMVTALREFVSRQGSLTVEIRTPDGKLIHEFKNIRPEQARRISELLGPSQSSGNVSVKLEGGADIEDGAPSSDVAANSKKENDGNSTSSAN